MHCLKSTHGDVEKYDVGVEGGSQAVGCSMYL